MPHQSFRPFLNDVASPLIFGPGKLIEHGSPRPDQIPNMAEKVIINTDGGKPVLAYWEFEGPEIENFPALLERTAAGFDEYLPSAIRVRQQSRGLTDQAAELGDTVSGVNKVIAATPAHMDSVNTSMVAGRREALAYAGDLGTLEDQALATVDAFGLLSAAPRAPTGSVGALGGGGTALTDWSPTPTGADDRIASDPRYTPSAGEPWEDYYATAYNLAKNGGSERERALGRNRARTAANKLGWPPPRFASGTRRLRRVGWRWWGRWDRSW